MADPVRTDRPEPRAAVLTDAPVLLSPARVIFYLYLISEPLESAGLLNPLG